MAMIKDAADRAAIDAFGRVGTAMITPFTPEGTVDLPAVEATVDHLVGLGNDMLVVSGTTGEASTTTDTEKTEILRAVVSAAAGRARVVAGVGTNHTAQSISLARSAQDAGAHGLLSVTPYYSRPTQDGIIAHTRALADATDLPVMLYDIPGRSATALDTQTILTLAEHPRILAVKDAKGSLAASQEVLASGTIAYYSGEDALNLPLLSIGAVGIVSVVGHVAADRFSTLVSLVASNDVAAARRIAADLVPLVDAIMNRMPGVVAAKAALELLGVIPSRTTRLPLLPADAQQVDAVRLALRRSEYLKC
ncbi:MAG TPA: 4-hydroxy-tetrahydrodipicolinate synthase [Brevibacterium senegalense]|uniref:4-hydroxy-tetrahydrodipicolinate synthase n=1 Tax=Brevibacterium senegalense TaxID=1033736 RepID=A0A921SP96_9MICO|nr:4-hydroxy-tetrahydrodipicolinate synthase [Brevibacterium senegalense]